MLTETQWAEFDERGIVRLTGVFDQAAATLMCSRIWEDLHARYGTAPAAPESWPTVQPTGFQALSRAGAFDAVAGAGLVAALDTLLGTHGWQRPRHWGVPLVTFPSRTAPWDVPHAQWHLDFPACSAGPDLVGLRVLAFLAPVRPHGGGTVVLVGSHRLVRSVIARCDPHARVHSAEVRRMFAQSAPWLRDLLAPAAPDAPERIQRFMDEGAEIDGAHVRVVELTGAPGEVIIMHPWVLHAPAANCGTMPRFMVSESIYRSP
jgi:ectoine hydroxylase-related dioxygenase (phytanoyl-CoA dioxygenase family)